jgi:hypothetical protein
MKRLSTKEIWTIMWVAMWIEHNGCTHRKRFMSLGWRKVVVWWKQVIRLAVVGKVPLKKR